MAWNRSPSDRSARGPAGPGWAERSRSAWPRSPPAWPCPPGPPRAVPGRPRWRRRGPRRPGSSRRWPGSTSGSRPWPRRTPAAQSRLEGLIQAAHRHQADLERSELALQATQAEYAGDVRDLYARGPLAPLELLLAAGDIHELALATGAAGVVLGRDLQALSRVGLAAGTVRARVQELGVTQAETLALRERLAGQEAAIGQLLATRKAMLATARAEVRALVRAEQARQEAARRAMVAAAAARARALGFAALADAPAPNPTAAAAVRRALGQVGKPYRWGATGPATFDCSGLVRFAYAGAGLSLPRTSRQLRRGHPPAAVAR